MSLKEKKRKSKLEKEIIKLAVRTGASISLVAFPGEEAQTDAF